MLRRTTQSVGVVLLRQSLADASVGGQRQFALNASHISSSLTNQGIRAGPGGRSSVSGIIATVFGGTGFLGRYVVASLARQGSQVVCPYRCDDLDMQHLRLMGDLGQMVNLPDFSARDDDFIGRAVEQSNVVINLIGSERETPRFKFQEVHVDIAERIAKAAAASGVCERLIHVSCLGASHNAASQRLQTKAAGEDAVRSAFPGATILRPATLVGTEDRLFNTWATYSKTLPRLPLIGRDASLQPVYVRDVSEALLEVLKDKGTAGKAYNLAGPQAFTRQQLVELTFDLMREKYGAAHVPAGMLQLAAKPREWLLSKGIAIPWPTMLTADQIAEAQQDIVLPANSADGTFKDLGIKPQRIDVGLPIEHVRHYRVGGYDGGTTSGTETPAGVTG